MHEASAGHFLIEGVELGAVADVPFRFGGPGVTAGDLDGTDIGADLAGGEAEEGAFAGAVVPDQAGDAGAQFEGNLVDADDGAIPLRDVVEEEDRRRAAQSLKRKRRMMALPSLTLQALRRSWLAHDLDAPRPAIQVNHAC